MNATAVPDSKSRTTHPATAKAGQAATPMAPAAPEHVVKPPRPERSHLRHFVQNVWTIYLEPGTRLEDLESVELCSLIASDLTKLDDVRLIAADGSFFADCVVAQKWQTSASLKVLRIIDLPEENRQQEKLIPDGFTITRASPGSEQPGYLVTRTADGIVLNLGQAPAMTFEAARRFLLDHATVRSEHAGIWRG